MNPRPLPLAMSPEAEQLRAFLRTVKAQPPAASIDEFRARIETLLAPYGPPEGTRTEPLVADGVPCEWVAGPGAIRHDRVLVWFHGGTYVGGSCSSHRGLAARLSSAAGCRVLTVDYRRAPEHPFPAAVDDAVAVVRWLLRQGFSGHEVAVGGDSAGSALAVAVSLAQRDASQTQPAALVLLSPWTDLAFTGPSFLASESRDPWMSGPRLRRSAGLYLGSGDAKDPRASPLYADLHGLPPLLIQVGGDEVLLDDATRFAQRAATAGVAVDLEVGEGLWHVWPLFAPALPEGRVALQRIGSWMRSRPGWG
jgi:epsilon-lactone hydrolase